MQPLRVNVFMCICVCVCVYRTKFFIEFYTETEEEKCWMLHNLLLEYHIAIHCRLTSGMFLVWSMSKQKVRTCFFQCLNQASCFFQSWHLESSSAGIPQHCPTSTVHSLTLGFPGLWPDGQQLCGGKQDTKKVRVKYERNKKPKRREENRGS